MNPVEILARVLRELKPDPSRSYEWGWKGCEFPNDANLIPEMVFIMLCVCLKYPYQMKPFEKTLWAIPILFKGVPCRIEHAKFGLRFHTSDEKTATKLLDELTPVLVRAFRIAEPLVRPLLHQQIEQGLITISNRFVVLDGRYGFFRTKAEVTFRTPDPPPHVTVNEEGKPVSWAYDLKSKREGFYFSVATLDAYFSRLEHFLVLALPFSGFDASKEDLARFLGSTWGDKFKRVVPIQTESEAKLLYDRLREVKERYRNTLAHGWFGKGFSSFYVHFPPIGAIPAELSRHRESVEFQIHPVTASTFSQICKLLDELEEYFSRGRLRFALKYAASGLDVAFDPKSIAEYERASTSDTDFEEFLERQGYFQDQFTNMDW